VSVENQKAAGDRIPLLLQTPAAVRFLSCEPLLESIDLGYWTHLPPCPQHPNERIAGWGHLPCDCRPFLEKHWENGMPKIDWIITGGGSGANARKCDLAWLRSLRDQCQDANIPLFVKQLGSNAVGAKAADHFIAHILKDRPFKTKDHKGGDISEFPVDLQIRQYPRGEK